MKMTLDPHRRRDTYLRGLKKTHQFLLVHSAYGAVLSSAFAILLLAWRVETYRSARFQFLSWNLFLAWIPYLAAIATFHLHETKHWRVLSVFPGLLWLAFFPNAPYLVTDLLHLRSSSKSTILLDSALLALFVFAGGVLTIASLNKMHQLVRRQSNSKLGWFFVFLVSLLSGIGIYWGRVIRLNSWNLMTDPRQVFEALHSFRDRQAVSYSVLFAMMILVSYVTCMSMCIGETNALEKRASQDENRRLQNESSNDRIS